MTKDTASRSGSITDAAGDAANTEKIATASSRKAASSGKKTAAKKTPVSRTSGKKAPAQENVVPGNAVPDKTAPGKSIRADKTLSKKSAASKTAPNKTDTAKTAGIKASPANDATSPSPEAKTPAKPAARKRAPAKAGTPSAREKAVPAEKNPQDVAAPSEQRDPRSAQERVMRDAEKRAPENAPESPANATTTPEKKPSAKRGTPRKRAAASVVTPVVSPAVPSKAQSAEHSGDSSKKDRSSGSSVKNTEPAAQEVPVKTSAGSPAPADSAAQKVAAKGSVSSDAVADKTPQTPGGAKRSRSRKKPASAPAVSTASSPDSSAPASGALPATPAEQPASPQRAARQHSPGARANGNGGAPNGSAKNKPVKPGPRSIAEAEAMLAKEKAARNTVQEKTVPEKAGTDAMPAREKERTQTEQASRKSAPEENAGTVAAEGATEDTVESAAAAEPAGAPEGEQKRRRRSRRGGRRRNKKNAAPASAEETGEAAGIATGETTGATDSEEGGARNTTAQTAQTAQAGLDEDARPVSSGDVAPGSSQNAVADESANAASEPGGKREKKGKNRSGAKDGRRSGQETRPGGETRESARAAEPQKNGEPEKEETSSGDSRRKMFISVLAGEQVEVVLTEEGQVLEYYVEMAHQAKIKGNIYKGVISNVDANLQAAFVSYGGSKNGFLQIDEVHPEYYQTPHDPSKRKYPLIQKALKPGQEILVQVVKEPAGTKGAFLTSYLSLPGRFLVLTPGREQIGVSRKVDNEEERARLRELLTGLKPGPGLGVIVRTVSMGATKTSLQRDLQFLKRLWKEVRGKGQEMSPPSLIYQELDLATRAIRDYLTDDVNDVWVDDARIASSMQEMADMLFPRKKNLVHIHKDADQGGALFERFGIQKQLDQIYSRDVALPSGGRLVFDHTEALTAIDINSGKSGGKSNFEDMAYRTNIEAARMIPLQLRLRDIGGQVVADFIEMRERDHWREVEKAVRAGMKGDRARYDVGKIGPFGMLEIVRQRLGSSAISVSTEPCPCCKGTGVRRNMEWQAMRALREINKLMRQAASQKQEKANYAVESELALHLLNTKRAVLETMEKEFGVKLSVSIGV